MHAFKYVVFSATDKHGNEYEVPVMFPTALTHAKMCDMSKMVMLREDYCELSPGPAISAGFCSLGLYKIECFGESESMGLKSRGQRDTDLFKQYDTYGHGRVMK